MDSAFESDEYEEYFGDDTRLNFSGEKLRLLPKSLVKDLKPHHVIKTLSEEAFIHLKVLKDLAAKSETDYYDQFIEATKINARKIVILKNIVEINMENVVMCEREMNDFSKYLNKEAVDNISEKEGKKKFRRISMNLIENSKHEATVTSAVLTSEVPMEIIEGSPPGLTAKILSPEDKSAVSESTETIEQLKMLQKRAEEESDVALEEQRSFTDGRLEILDKVEKKLTGTLSKIKDLLKDCEDPDLNNLLEQNKSFVGLQLRVAEHLVACAKLDKKVKMDRIKLDYDVHLYENRIDFLELLKSSSEEK